MIYSGIEPESQVTDLAKIQENSIQDKKKWLIFVPLLT
jgi:hypothetical protein